MSQLVTGEAVALDLPPASIGSRILSGFLDYLIVWVATFTLVSAGTAMSQQLDDALIAATVLVCFLVAWLVYPVTIETLTRGRSLGKMAAGLRTVRDDAGPITFRHAFTRGLLGVVEVYLFWGIPAVIASILSSKGKRLGDMIELAMSGMASTVPVTSRNAYSFLSAGVSPGPAAQMTAPTSSSCAIISSLSRDARQPGIDSSLSSVPPVWPRPRPDIIGIGTPHSAASGASTSDVLSPTPPVLCLSTFGPGRSDRS